MPYQVQSHCGACHQGDSFVIGNWPDCLGVVSCAGCRALVNVPVADGKCPGCSHVPAAEEFYDYSLAIPYLGGLFPEGLELAPGPACPKCQRGPVAFEATAHLNMAMVVGNRQAAQASWGRNYMEKAIFANSTLPVIEENRLSPGKVFEYFNLDVPPTPLVTTQLSFPIALDISKHLQTKQMFDPRGFVERFSGAHPQNEAIAQALLGDARQYRQPQKPQKRWWQFWR